MKWASSLAVGANLADCVSRAAGEIQVALGEEPVDLTLVFVAHQHHAAFEQVPDLVQEHLPTRQLAGCSGGGVLAGGYEEENRAAVALAAARLPGVEVRARHLRTDALPDEDAPPAVWREWMAVREQAHFILLADPFSSAMEPFLTGLDFAYPHGAKVGGMASGGRRPGENALFLGPHTHRDGLLSLAFHGNVVMDPIVAQGCRPIGQPLTVTGYENNILLEVDHQPPLNYLAGLLEKLDEYDRQLMRTSLFLGLQADEPGIETGRNEFLIRNLVGIDYQRGILAVSAALNEGQVVQFHLRDKITSVEDVDTLLARQYDRAPQSPVAGALLFSCLGRGQRLYGEPHHDSRKFGEIFGPAPLAGFFCNGEIGPIGTATHLHGYTSSFALFRPARAVAPPGG